MKKPNPGQYWHFSAYANRDLNAFGPTDDMNYST